MKESEEKESSLNYEKFRDCFSAVLLDRLAKPNVKSKHRSKSSRKRHKAAQPAEQDDAEPGGDAEELAEFIEYLASATFACLPDELRTLDHRAWAQSTDLPARYALPLAGQDMPSLVPSLDPSVSDSLAAYGVVDEHDSGTDALLAAVLSAYVAALATPPSVTKGSVTACEMCGRDWIPLTYHHLIPRFVHAKAVRRGWHPAEALQDVAWLCRACHSFVHGFASHEDLARHYYTVELLMAQEEIVSFARWAGRLRWKKR